ncbi:Hypothetical predicted protein, partial [Paramuricea clavata]
YGTETKGYRFYDPQNSRADKHVTLKLSNDNDVVVEDDQADAEINERQPVRERRAPDRFGEWVTIASTDVVEPTTHDVRELPKDQKAVGCKWVFKVKHNADGSIERHKARLVAQCFSQRYGVDYDETFSPVVRFESIRTVIALSVQKGLKLHQVDVTAAFLNGELEDEVYVKQSEGLEVKGKQTSEEDGDIFIVAIHVDDIILAGKTDEKIAKVKESIAERFQVKDMGELQYILGLQVIQEDGKVWIGQPTYTASIIKKYDMENCKPVETHVNLSSKLVSAMEDSELFNKEEYQSAVVSLLYLSSATRPDITFAVNNVAKFSANPTNEHWTAVKRIFRYLKGTVNYGLLYSENASPDCVGFSDADWAGDLNDRKSTSGYRFQINGAAVSWRSKKKTCVALSTAEAEYVAFSAAAQEALWMGQLLTDLNVNIDEPVTIYEGNQSAIAMSKNLQFHGRSKHIDIKYHFVRDQVEKKTLTVLYCPTGSMLADLFTKGIAKEQFKKLRELTGVAIKPK